MNAPTLTPTMSLNMYPIPVLAEVKQLVKNIQKCGHRMELNPKARVRNARLWKKAKSHIRRIEYLGFEVS